MIEYYRKKGIRRKTGFTPRFYELMELVKKTIGYMNTLGDYKIVIKQGLARTSFHRAAFINRLPNWANLEKIKKIYFDCPEGYVIDHIIPLKSKYVSGLHVESNLQYLEKSENLRKNNKYEINNKKRSSRDS